MRTKPLELISSESFWALNRKFEAAHGAREEHLPLEVQAKNYDRFYGALIRHLRAVGSHVEGGGDGDFSTSRYVDPNDVTVVVSDTDAVFLSCALDAAFDAITEAGVSHMVIFDTGSYVAVLPDGSVVGYSDDEDLLMFDRQRCGEL